MTAKALYFEGQTNGTTVSALNSDDFGDSALVTANIGAGNACTYSTDFAYPGTVSVKFVTTTSGFDYMELGAFSSNSMVQTFYIYITDTPSQDTTIATFRTGAAQVGGLNITTGRVFQVTRSGGTVVFTGSTQIPVNQWVRVNFACVVATTSTGQANLAWYSTPGGTTATETYTSGATLNMGTTALTVARLGKNSNASNWATTFYVDSWRVQDGTSTFYGPLVSDVSGTVAAVSAASLAVTMTSQVSGTIAAVSAVSGVVTSTGQVSGTAAAVSAVTGEVASVLQVAGTIDAVSAVSATVTATLQVDGIAAATSAVSLAVASTLQVAGTVAAVSAVTGDVDIASGSTTLDVEGTVAAVSGVTGDVVIIRAVAGTVAAVSDTTGLVATVRPIQGTVTATSEVTGTVAAVYTVAGQVDAVSGVTCTVTAVYTISGTVAAVSGVTLSVIIGGPIRDVTLTATLARDRLSVRLAANRLTARLA